MLDIRLLRQKRRRLEKGWTLTDLSEASGISRIALSMLERGVRVPRPHTIMRIAQALECEPKDLMEPEST